MLRETLLPLAHTHGHTQTAPPARSAPPQPLQESTARAAPLGPSAELLPARGMRVAVGTRPLRPTAAWRQVEAQAGRGDWAARVPWALAQLSRTRLHLRPILPPTRQHTQHFQIWDSGGPGGVSAEGARSCCCARRCSLWRSFSCRSSHCWAGVLPQSHPHAGSSDGCHGGVSPGLPGIGCCGTCSREESTKTTADTAARPGKTRSPAAPSARGHSAHSCRKHPLDC